MHFRETLEKMQKERRKVWFTEEAGRIFLTVLHVELEPFWGLNIRIYLMHYDMPKLQYVWPVCAIRREGKMIRCFFEVMYVRKDKNS